MVQETIKRLKELGRMPDSSEDNIPSDRIGEYVELIKKTNKPINWEEAKILIMLFPEYELFGIEWSLLHLFETIFSQISLDDYRKLIIECPSEEWKDTLKTRLNNKLQCN